MKQGDKVRLIRVVCVLTREDELGTPRILGDVLQLPCSRRRHGKCRGVRPGTCAHEDELELIEPEFKVGDWAEHVVDEPHIKCRGCKAPIIGVSETLITRDASRATRDCHSKTCWRAPRELKPCPAPTGIKTEIVGADIATQFMEYVTPPDYAEDKPPQSGIERTDAMRWVEYVIVTKTTTDEDGKVVPEKPVVPADDKGPLPRVWTDLSGQDFTDLVGDLNREAIMGAGGTPKVQVIPGPFGQK